MSWPGLREVSLMTTSRGPIEEDVFFVLAFDAEPDRVIGMSDADGLLPELQKLPGFDNETFIKAMGVCDEGVFVLWRRDR